MKGGKVDFKEKLKSEKSRLSRSDKARLGIAEPGRPAGSKSKKKKYGRQQLYAALKKILWNSASAGELMKMTQKKAAEALGLGHAKNLQRMLRDFGETRSWRELRKELGNEE
jgi:hypothetical protein